MSTEWLTSCNQKDAMHHFKSCNAPQVGHPCARVYTSGSQPGVHRRILGVRGLYMHKMKAK